jgi:hypothetical protein
MSSERKKAASSKWRFPRDLSARGALRQGRHADPDSGDAQAGRELGLPSYAHGCPRRDCRRRLVQPAPTNGSNTRCVSMTCCRTTMIRSFAPTMSNCSMPILPLISCAHILLWSSAVFWWENSFFSRPEELLRELRGRTAASQSYRG